MLTAIVRLYSSAAPANAAANELLAEGFSESEDRINLVAPAGAGQSALSEQAVTAAIIDGYVLAADAKQYAKAVLAGHWLLSIVPQFGSGDKATAILDSHGPVADGIRPQRDGIAGWDDATPMSSALWLPLLTDPDASFSGFFSLPLLTRRGSTLGSALHLPEVKQSAEPFRSTLGLPLLSGSAAPLSSLLHLPVLL
jgi:hypothetical protein